MKRLGRWLPRTLGGLVLIWLLSRADWPQIGDLITRLSVSQLIVLPFFTILMLGVRAKRWQGLVNLESGPISLLRAGSIYAAGAFLGSFTPGRLGDLAKAVYLYREYCTPWKKALAATLLDRIFDLVILACVGLWAVVWLGRVPQWFWLVYSLLLLVGVLFAYICKKAGRWRHMSSKWPLGKAGQFIAESREELLGLARKASVSSLLLTALAYGCYFCQVILLARVLEIPLSDADVVATIALVGLAAFLPISVAGFGTREGILVWVLSERAVPNSIEVAVVFSAGFLFFCFVVPAALGGICWLKTPLSMQAVHSGQHIGDESVESKSGK